MPRGHELWEIYALAAAPLPARLRAGGRTLRVFPYGAIAVIAGTPGPGSAADEAALRAHHELVLELAGRVDPLLPARFGSRMTPAQMAAAIGPAAARLHTALEHVRGRQQMTIRLEGPAEPDPDLDAAGPGAPTGAAYLERRRAAASVPTAARPLVDAVEPLVVDRRIRPGRGPVRATLFHLVARADVAHYRRAAERALPSVAPWRATLSGPFPPFAFAPEPLA